MVTEFFCLTATTAKRSSCHRNATLMFLFIFLPNHTWRSWICPSYHKNDRGYAQDGTVCNGWERGASLGTHETIHCEKERGSWMSGILPHNITQNRERTQKLQNCAYFMFGRWAGLMFNNLCGAANWQKGDYCIIPLSSGLYFCNKHHDQKWLGENGIISFYNA